MDTGLQSFISNIELFQSEIISNKKIKDGVYLLTIKYNEKFIPGQVVGLSLNPKDPPRLYSIASAGSDQKIDILFNIKDGGSLTPQLSRLKASDTIYISHPFGAFLGDDKPAWWIASGTGIAPYRSMSLAGLYKNKKLIHGGRTLEDFYFYEEFKDLFGSNYIRCSSRLEHPEVFHGRITKYLEQQDHIPKDINYYLCGNSEMVVDVREILISKGVPFLNIMAEIYF
ncbi:MAG: FAD-binding oxidoreductase [Hyphomicrobiales bacterium]